MSPGQSTVRTSLSLARYCMKLNIRGLSSPQPSAARRSNNFSLSSGILKNIDFALFLSSACLIERRGREHHRHLLHHHALVVHHYGLKVGRHSRVEWALGRNYGWWRWSTLGVTLGVMLSVRSAAKAPGTPAAVVWVGIVMVSRSRATAP
jgi:hypothetical protein